MRYVLDIKGTPLMPCCEKRATPLLGGGRARDQRTGRDGFPPGCLKRNIPFHGIQAGAQVRADYCDRMQLGDNDGDLHASIQLMATATRATQGALLVPGVTAGVSRSKI